MHSYQDELAALQQHVLIGDRHGLAILHATAGNVAQAVARIQQELTEVVARKADVPIAEARQALAQAGYHVAPALEYLDKQRHSLTERLLRRHKKPWGAMGKVAQAVEAAYQVPRDYWLQVDAARSLPPVPRCVLVVWEWLSYESWETLDAALSFHLEAVLAEFDQQLALPQVADTLRQLLIQRNIDRRRQQRSRSHLRRPPLPEYVAAEELFDTQRPLIEATLYAFIQQHTRQLP